MDNEKLKRMRQRRGEIFHEQRSILDAAPGGILEKGSEADTRFDALSAEDDKLKAGIEAEERVSGNGDYLSQPQGDPARPEPRNDGDPETRKVDPLAAPEYLAVYRRYLRSGDTRGVITHEQRATADGLQADADTAGGFTILPQQVATTFIKGLDDIVAVRQFAHVERVSSAASLGAVSLDADPEDGDWTQELTTVDFDTQMEFGKRELRPHELTKGIKVSRKLLARSTQPIESLVNDRLTYKFGVTHETAFMTGNGVNKPLGIFTASADGINTDRDITAAATTTFTGDELINTLYNVKAQYQATGRWIIHRNGVKIARKLKGGDGQYIWQPGLQGGQPDLILGRPYIQSEYAPSTFLTTTYAAAFGDLSYYWIADAEDISIQRLVELYAATNQVGFIARAATDGMPVLSEAFSRLVLA